MRPSRSRAVCISARLGPSRAGRQAFESSASAGPREAVTLISTERPAVRNAGGEKSDDDVINGVPSAPCKSGIVAVTGSHLFSLGSQYSYRDRARVEPIMRNDAESSAPGGVAKRSDGVRGSYF